MVAAQSLRRPFRRVGYISKNFFRWLIGSTKGPPVTIATERTIREKPLHWTAFVNPLNWILWPIYFIASFAISRPYRLAGPALFSVAILAAVAFLFAQQQYQGGKSHRVEQYQRFLQNASDRKDYQAALICSKTLIDLQPNEPRFQLERARIEKELGNTDFAYQLAYRLALLRKSGLAALWLTEQKFQLENIKQWTEEEHLQYRGLMSIAVNQLTGINGDVAKVKLAAYLSAMNANGEALKYLEDVVSANPQYALSAAEMALKINDQIKLQSLLPIARNYYEELLKQSPENLDVRLFLARTLVIDDDLDQAIQLLQDGMRLKVNEKYQSALAEALAYKAARLSTKKSNPDVVLQRMSLVLDAAKLAPNNALVVESLIEMLIEFRKDQNQEIAVLREAALQGLSPEAVHFVRGTIALMDNQMEDAQTHLKLAADGGMKLPGILNNLSVAIAKSPGGDLTQALSLSNEAIQQMPHPYLFETRGQILYKMGKYQECILDLEKGLQAEPLVKEILPNLADAYRQIGNLKLASEYEKRLELLNTANIPEENPADTKIPAGK
jgi:tetratricopeptide (TPR) repeat protein